MQLSPLQQIELIQVKLPLVHPFRTSFGEETHKNAILVKITDQNGNVGWGETSVEAKPSYCYETLQTGWHIQNDFLIPRISDVVKDEFTLSDVKTAWSPIRGHEFAKSGIESALWHLKAVSEEKSLGRLYGSTKEKIPTGVSIGIQPSIDDLLQRIDRFVNLGYQKIKMKIEPGWDNNVLKQVRKEFGDIPVMVDANSAYSLDDIEIFKSMDQYELMMIEQPLAYNDMFMHKILQDQITTPVCLDESIHTVTDAKYAIEFGCCKIINIKPGRVGGYENALKIASDIGKDAVWCGGMLETGIGRLHNMFFQARDEFTIPGDTSGSDRYFNPDIIDPPVRVDETGHITMPNGVGFGHEVVEKAIDGNAQQKRLIAFD